MKQDFFGKTLQNPIIFLIIVEIFKLNLDTVLPSNRQEAPYFSFVFAFPYSAEGNKRAWPFLSIIGFRNFVYPLHQDISSVHAATERNRVAPLEIVIFF